MTLLLSDQIRVETFPDFVEELDVTGEEIADALSDHNEQEMVKLENHARDDGEQIDSLDAVAPADLDEETLLEIEIRYPSIIPEILDHREEKYIHTHRLDYDCHEIFRVKGRGESLAGDAGGGEANA